MEKEVEDFYNYWFSQIDIKSRLEKFICEYINREYKLPQNYPSGILMDVKTFDKDS